MADNFDFTEGAGSVGAADDVGGVYYPKVKLVDGTADSDTIVAVDVGVKANALRVAPANDITDGTYIGDIKFGEALTTVTTVSTVTNLAQMSGTAIAMNEGVLAAGVQRVTLATDDDAVAHLATIAGDTTNIETAVQLLDNAVYVDDADWIDDTSSHLLVGGIYQSADHTVTDGDVSPFQVDVNGCIVLGTGAKAIGKLAANTGVDIGDVDVLSIAAGDNNIGNVDIVSGTVTTVSTVTSLSQLGGQAINLGEGVIATGTQRVTIATDDDGVASLGIIDDWDATHDSAASADGPQLMAAYDATKPAVVEDGDAVRVLADEYGRLLSGVEKTHFQAVFDSANATAEANVVHASAASTIIVVQSYVISVDIEGWIKLQDEASAALTGKFWLKAGGGVAITLPDKAPIILGVDKDLEVICEAAGNVSVSVTGYTVPG